VWLSRRSAVAALGGLLPAGLRPAKLWAAGPAALGAIRWDAWDSPGSIPTEAMVRSLSPPAWRHRAPDFAEVGPDGTLRFPSADLARIARQDALARAAGIDFWAFVAYPAHSSMRLGFDLYRANPAPKPRFCFLTEASRWLGLAGEHAPAMSDPSYQLVAGRPLYFLGFFSDGLIADRFGGIEGLALAIRRFRDAVRDAGAGNPYLVLMTGDPDQARRWVPLAGFDAVSAYALYGGARAAPYADLVSHTEARWRALAEHAPTIPTAMTGWDRRPRVEHPVPWEAWQRPGVGLDRHHLAGTPAEIAQHIRRALHFAAGQRPATALIYAWNEHDEGGWLHPTLPNDDSRLRALRAHICAAEPAEACVRRAP
jgi:hypothetical protein